MMLVRSALPHAARNTLTENASDFARLLNEARCRSRVRRVFIHFEQTLHHAPHYAATQTVLFTQRLKLILGDGGLLRRVQALCIFHLLGRSSLQFSWRGRRRVDLLRVHGLERYLRQQLWRAKLIDSIIATDAKYGTDAPFERKRFAKKARRVHVVNIWDQIVCLSHPCSSRQAVLLVKTKYHPDRGSKKFWCCSWI